MLQSNHAKCVHVSRHRSSEQLSSAVGIEQMFKLNRLDPVTFQLSEFDGSGIFLASSRKHTTA